MKKLILKVSLVAGLLATTLFSQAQQTNNWYFGSAGCFANAGMRIDFTSGSPVVSTGNPMETQEGSSSISDAITGAPLFYTDGTDAWEAAGNTKFSTFSLGGGSSSAQSAIILPKPGTTTQWFIFTVDVNGVNGAHYVTVQKVAGAFSVIEAAPVTLVAAGVIGEGLCIIGSTKASSAYWVIMRDRASTGQIRAFEVTSAGGVVTTAVTSALSGTGFSNTNYNQYIGIIKSNTCQNKLAFTYYNNDVDISNFDPSTGKLVAGTAKRITKPAGAGFVHSYGLEFSPNDKYLYITALDEGKVYQYDTSAASPYSAVQIGDVNPGGTANNEAAQLQVAPDGNIYMARMNGTCPGTSYLASIASPNTATPTFTANAILLSAVLNGAGNNGGSFRGLPTFTKSLIASSLTAQPGNGGYCINTNIPLSYVFGGFAVSQIWTITPGVAGTDWVYVTGTNTSVAPTVLFKTAGTYTVNAAITDNCGNVTNYPMTLTISTPKIPAGLITCGTNSLTLTATGTVPADYPNYIWYDAATGGNVIGTGSPVTIGYASLASAPSSVWVEVGGSVTNTSSGTNQLIGPTIAMNSWPGRGAGVAYSTTFTVYSNILTLNSFDVVPMAGSGTFDVQITNAASTVVFLKTYTAGTLGAANTLAIGANFPPGTYTISLQNSSTIVWGGGTYAGASNAQINFPTSGGANTFGISNLNYNYKNFTTTSTCTQRVKVDRHCLTVSPGDGTYCTGVNIPLSYTFEGTVSSQSWTISPGVNNTDWKYISGNNTSTSPTIQFMTAGTYTVTVAVTDVTSATYSKSMTFTVNTSVAVAGTVSCSAPNLVLDNPAADPNKPNYIWYANSVAPGNIIGTGTPLSYPIGVNGTEPSQICIGLSSSAPTATVVTSKSIAASVSLTQPQKNTPYTSQALDVLANRITLKSVDVHFFGTVGSVTYTLTIKLGATTVFAQSTTATAPTAVTIPINTTLLQGTGYTFVITSSPSGITLLTNNWSQTTNANEVTYYDQPSGANSYSDAVANIQYDAYNYTTTTGCALPTCIPVSCSLPIKLLSFTGVRDGDKNILNWITASEKNNAYFEVQKSTDNMNFETIGKVNGNGTTNSIQYYNFTDNNVTGTINYYRIIQYDFDGKMSISSIVSIETSSGSSVIVAPNPSHDAFNVALSEITTTANFTVLDVLGREIYTTTITKGTSLVTFGSDFQSGAYILQVKTSDQVFIQRIIKE